MVDRKRADVRIQQMSFMILFVFIFFSVAALFFLSIHTRGIKENFADLQRETAIASISTISNMPELNCDSSRTLCLDEDKLYVFASHSSDYEEFWPVASIKVRKVFPKQREEIQCPSSNCSFYKIYVSTEKNIQEYGTFVNICKKTNDQGYIQEECGIGRLEVGIKIKP
jgi:hypothetical protein